MVESDEWIDDTTFRVHLIEGATWSDGHPFDADDVVFTIDSVLNPKIGSVMTGDMGPRVKDAVKIDDYTVDFILYDTYPDIKALLSSYHFALVPEHILGDIPVEDWKTHISHTGEDLDQLLPGLGIYKFKSWTRGEQWQLELRDPDVPASEGGLLGYTEVADDAPRTITYVIIPDPTTALAALENGEIDALNYGMTDDLLGELPRLLETDGIAITEYEEASFGYVTVNHVHPILANPHVRVALWYALDRERIRDEIYFGLPKLQETVLTPVQPYYDATIKGPSFDLEKAKAELVLAGYKEWGLEKTASPVSSLYLPIGGGLVVGAVIGAAVIYSLRRRSEESEE
jgi:peptide/nickel transport system substrate-binding protein